MAPNRGAEGEAKWQTLANWNTDRAREKAILDRLIEEEIPEVAETAETAESFGLTEEQAERWQPIVQQRVEAYVKQKANALKGADTGVFYDAGIELPLAPSLHIKATRRAWTPTSGGRSATPSTPWHPGSGRIRPRLWR